MFGLSELAVILIVVILVIGAKKLPDLARSAGKSARILKAEARAMKDEEDKAVQAKDLQVKAEADTPPQVIEGKVITSDSGPVPGTGRPPSQTHGAPRAAEGQDGTSRP